MSVPMASADPAAAAAAAPALPEETVDLFTDGACSGNPGPGGWGVLLRWRECATRVSISSTSWSA